MDQWTVRLQNQFIIIIIIIQWKFSKANTKELKIHHPQKYDYNPCTVN